MEPLVFSWVWATITNSFYQTFSTLTNPQIVWPVLGLWTTGKVVVSIVLWILFFGVAVVLFEFLFLGGVWGLIPRRSEGNDNGTLVERTVWDDSWRYKTTYIRTKKIPEKK